MKIKNTNISAALLAFLCLDFVSAHAGTIYLTADNLNGTNLFGTLDVATGHFSQIATTDPVFLALTSGPGGKLTGADGNSGGLFRISKSGATTPYGSVTALSAFYGLAYSRSIGKFFAANLDPMSVDLYSIAGNGNSSSFVGQLAGPNARFFPTGSLAYGADGTLYFNYSSDTVNATNSLLYSVNTSTGALTPIGTGLGTTLLALFSDGKTLYGVDAFDTSDIGVFSINTTTGAATRISTVTGLPVSGDFFVDTVAVKTPEAGSTLTLLFVGLIALLAGGLRRLVLT